MFTPEQLLANSQTRLRDAIAERKAAQDELLALREVGVRRRQHHPRHGHQPGRAA